MMVEATTVEKWQRLVALSETKDFDTKCRLCGKRGPTAGFFRDYSGYLLVFWHHGNYNHIGRATLDWKDDAVDGWPLAVK